MAHEVIIQGMKYNPPSLTIKIGDTVTWINKDDMTHTATAPFPVKKPYKWNSGDMEQDDQKSVTFNDPSWQGKYGCIYHPSMEGEIIIKS
jgi:plastocyanin